jgi:hypothetical protein
MGQAPTKEEHEKKFMLYIDVDLDDHVEVPLEELSYRQLVFMVNDRLRDELQAEGHQYTLNEDFLQNNPIPPGYLCFILLFHDWPHETPEHMVRFMEIFADPVNRPTVPSREQALFIMMKTHYMNECAKHQIPMQPTFIVKPDSDLAALSSAITAVCEDGKFVSKKNFSASAEEVMVHDFKENSEIVAILQGLQATINTVADGHAYYSREFLVQRHEPRFRTEVEIRTYWCHGEFLYAMQGGWINGPGEVWVKPFRLDPQTIPEIMSIAQRMLEVMPMLQTYYLIRFDFGPGPLLNEIELFADTFGGPEGNMMGDEWMIIRGKIVDAIIKDVRAATAGTSTSLVDTEKDTVKVDI